MDESPGSRASQAMARAVVWDNHACLPLEDPERIDRHLPELRRYRDAGVDFVSINIAFGELGIDVLLKALARFRAWIERNDGYVLVRTAEDVVRAKAAGDLAIAFDIEGAAAIDRDLSLISLYYDLGVRWMLIAYNRNNAVGGGCHDDDRGLTEFGRTAVAEMERVGMVVCCSHTGEKTAADVIALATKPVILSHSNAAALVEHPRNVGDDLIKACAGTGGVIGINGVSIFLGDPTSSADAIVRHVDHCVQLVGADHVGLGLDFVFDQEELDRQLVAMAGTFPEGHGYRPGIMFAGPERFHQIADRLVRLGYPDPAIDGILGMNFLRVARSAWA